MLMQLPFLKASPAGEGGSHSFYTPVQFMANLYRGRAYRNAAPGRALYGKPHAKADGEG